MEACVDMRSLPPTCRSSSSEGFAFNSLLCLTAASNSAPGMFAEMDWKMWEEIEDIGDWV
jgi:hypothetical protein